MSESHGQIFRKLITTEAPLQIVGTVNAYSAMLAAASGLQAIYLSGAGVANASFGLPDLGMTTLTEVLEDARRITAACSLPLLVDVDTGFGHVFNIARTVQLMEQACVAAIHIEDQVTTKRCGHRPGKTIVTVEAMEDRIKAAVDARLNSDFVIMARTDAYATEGMASAIERAQRYIEAGADMIFPEAMTTLEAYQTFAEAVNVPILANITEFGKTPLFTKEELKAVGVQLILYPLSGFRAMSYAALQTYQTIRQDGTQKPMLNQMQTREDLYRILHYYTYEKKIDQMQGKGETDGQ